MAALRCKHPLNRAATRAANEDFYKNHPEMIVGGKRVPIDPCDTRQAKLRREWVKSYGQNGGAVEKVRARTVDQCRDDAKKTFKPVPVASPVKNCPGSKAKANVTPVRKPTPQNPKTPPCELLKTVMTCQHGRQASTEGKLMVVPGSIASTGDKISVASTMNGGCGPHPNWTVGGFWDSHGTGTKFDFNAAKWVPPVVGLLSLRAVSPHIYRVDTSACYGAAGAWEVKAYPPGAISAKIDGKKITQKIVSALKKIPIADEEIEGWSRKILQGEVQYSGGWKEDEKSWRAYYEMSISGAFDPLIAAYYKGPVYPLTLVPGWLAKWVKAGVFFEVTLGFKVSIGITGKYWPDIDRSQWTEKNFKGGGSGSGALSIELKFASSDFVEGAISGETGIEGIFSSAFDHDVSVDFTLKWNGVKGKATCKAFWGYAEWSREFQLLPEGEIYKHNFMEDTQAGQNP